jgi:ornithine cyclodeaminase/alanine dehydrogenase-like protein (mu-crystallin family)
MLILSRADVERLLDLDRLIDAIADAMVELSAGTVSMPPRVAASVDKPEGLLVAMPSYLPGAGALATKLVTVFPANRRRGLPSHQAVIAMFEPETGTPVAVMDGEFITAMRTAAGSALSARLLARPVASTIAIVGTGVEARSHGVMLPRVRAFSRGLVAGRDRGKAEKLAADLSEVTGIPFGAAASFPDAVDGADVVCAATHATEPVVRREWLAPGTHVTSVGFNAEGSEIDAALVSGSVVVVESRATSLAPFPAGAVELAAAIRDGSLRADDVVEIGELVAGVRKGRTGDDQITLYRSVGVAVQDAAAAALVLEAARAQGAGTDVPL